MSSFGKRSRWHNLSFPMNRNQPVDPFLGFKLGKFFIRGFRDSIYSRVIRFKHRSVEFLLIIQKDVVRFESIESFWSGCRLEKVESICGKSEGAYFEIFTYYPAVI